MHRYLQRTRPSLRAALAAGAAIGMVAATAQASAPNSPPTASADVAVIVVNEGESALNSGTFNDVDGDTVAVTASVGSITQGSGQWIHQQTIAEGGFPIELVLDNQENLYVANVNDTVYKYDASGSLVTSWTVSGSPKGICVNSSLGAVYVVASEGRRIDKFTLDGTFLSSWGSAGTGDGQFDRPHGCAVDASGEVYVSDAFNSRVQVFDAGGTFLRKWGSLGSGNGEFNFNQGIRISTSGTVYVVDRQNNRVQYFDSSGTYLGQWGSAGAGNGEFSSPASVGIDPGGNVYIGDLANNRIQKFTAAGAFLDKLGPSTPVGDMSFPHGTAFPPAGRSVYIADFNNGRVLKFATPGSWSWSYPTTDGPNQSQTITIYGTDTHSAVGTATFSLVVNNVAPTIALTGNSNVTAGSLYTLSLGAITDPGTDTVTAFHIDWGDTSEQDFSGSPANTSKTHTYLSTTTYEITVTLTDEDGTYTGGTKTVTVDEAATPTSTPTDTPTNSPTRTPTNTPTSSPTNTTEPTATPTVVVTCPPAPGTCATSARARFRLNDKLNDTRDKLKWRFTRGGFLTQSSFGDPTTDAAFALCIYDDNALKLEAHIPPSAYWRRHGSTGYDYKDKAGSADGITNIRLRAGGSGKSQMEVRGKGTSLPLPAPVSSNRYFNAATRVVVQLRQANGACYGTGFAPAQTKPNSVTTFGARF